MADPTAPLTVAVTGPTGTFGSALIPFLEDDDRVGTVVGVARRPFDPAARGWSKMTYRQGDVRRPEDLRAAFADADVVVHLAFLILGGAPETSHSINVEGTLNAFREAVAAGASRFVYASSIAAYGFHADNPVGMDEDWPTRPADRLAYAQQKADLEQLLAGEAAAHPEVEVYMLRPPIVLGPDTLGGKMTLPPQSGRPAQAAASAWSRRCPSRWWCPTCRCSWSTRRTSPGRCISAWSGRGPGRDLQHRRRRPADRRGRLPRGRAPAGARCRAGPVGAAVRAALRVPGLPTFTHWLETISHPAVMDASRAKDQLGWRPGHSALDSLRSALGDLPAD